MTDAHYHRDGYATFLSLGDREFRFYGLHPWQALDLGEAALLSLREKLAADPHAGVGEIGLDRLKEKTINPAQRAVFAAQKTIPCTACHYCVYDSECPKRIPIPELFSCYNRKQVFHSWNENMYYHSVTAGGSGKGSSPAP